MVGTTNIDTRFAALENMLKGFVLSQASINFRPKRFHVLNVNPPTIPYVHAVENNSQSHPH